MSIVYFKVLTPKVFLSLFKFKCLTTLYVEMKAYEFDHLVLLQDDHNFRDKMSVGEKPEICSF